VTGEASQSTKSEQIIVSQLTHEVHEGVVRRSIVTFRAEKDSPVERFLEEGVSFQEAANGHHDVQRAQ
jgi:hypothetical protein